MCSLNVGDFEVMTGRIMILGKGGGSQKAPVTLSAKAADAITKFWLVSGHGYDASGPLFRADQRGNRRTVDGHYAIMTKRGDDLGMKRTMHGLRHGSITAVLDASGAICAAYKN